MGVLYEATVILIEEEYLLSPFLIGSTKAILLYGVCYKEEVYYSLDYVRGPLERALSCSSFFLNRSTTTLSDPII